MDKSRCLPAIALALSLTLSLPAALAAEEAKLAPGMVNPGYHEPPSWFKESFLDLRDDIKEATKAKRRVLLYFYQDGCPYCSKLLADNFGQKTIADKTRLYFDVISINLWGDREVTDLGGKVLAEKAFAKGLKVQFTPTLLFLDEKGDTALRLNGYSPPHKFMAALDYAGQHLERKQNFADYLAANAKEAARPQLNDATWLIKPPLKLAEAVKKNDRPLLVLFEQKDCAACDEMHDEAFSRPEVKELLAKFQIARIDMAAKEPLQTPDGASLPARQWARKIGVHYTPSLVFFASGKEVFRVDGYLRPFHLSSSLDYVASGAYQTQPEFQRFIEARAAARRAKGEKIELMQ